MNGDTHLGSVDTVNSKTGEERTVETLKLFGDKKAFSLAHGVIAHRILVATRGH